MPVVRHLVTLTAGDGSAHDALFEIDERAARVRERLTGRRAAIVHVHGIMGNFLVGTLRFLPAPLARSGFPMLVLETRMGNVGQLFGQAILEDAVQDVDAGVEWLHARGFDSVIVSGYSSGATVATRYAAAEPGRTGLRGLVCLGNPWGLPQSLARRSRELGSEPPYQEVAARVRAALAEGETPDRDRLFVIERSRGPSSEPRDSEVYTYRTWWHSRGPEAVGAMAHRQIGSVRVPVLLVQGTEDEMVMPEEAVALGDVARRAGNPDVSVVRIDGAGHAFRGREVATIDAVAAWLRAHA